MSSPQFFRWKPTLVILIVLTALYGICSPLNIFLGSAAARRGDQQVSHVLYWGAFWNAVVAILCFWGWRLMRRRAPVYLAAGAAAIAVALFIVMRIWISGLIHGQNLFPLIEAVFTWLPMFYVIIYALYESRQKAQI